MTTTAIVDDLNDVFERATRSAAAPLAVDTYKPSRLWNGYYTLTFPSEEHRTFRVYTQTKRSLRGRRILSLLIGPDNSKDYEDFAFVDEKGPSVWKRFRGHKQEQYAALIWDLAGGEKIEGYSLLVTRHCFACNHLLTDPVSIRCGVGPLCRERIGMSDDVSEVTS